MGIVVHFLKEMNKGNMILFVYALAGPALWQSIQNMEGTSDIESIEESKV